MVGFNPTVTLPQNFQPTWFANCLLWLDSTLGLTFNGSAISAWADKTGVNGSFVQTTGSKQPTYVASKSTYGGAPVLQYVSTSSQILTGAIVAGQAQPFTTYVVGESDNTNNNVFWNESTTGVGPGSGASGTQVAYAYAGSVLNSTGSTASPAVMCMIFNNTTSTIYVNNSQSAVASGTTGNHNIGSTSNDFGIGSTTGGNGLTGFIGAVLLFAGSHTATQRTTIFAFLGAKYGMNVH